MAKAKEIEGLHCEASAADGIRLVLLARLNEVCQFRAAALDWSDPEGVHDMRVAARRLRSALKDFKPYLRQGRKLASSASELKRIADALGEVRDQDVAIIALEKLQNEAPAEATAGIIALTTERRAEREAVRTALAAAISEAKLLVFQEEFASATMRATTPRSHQGKKKKAAAELSFSELGREIIRDRIEELRELSACLYQPFKIVPLHRMRIAAKRLRYAMELFAICQSHELVECAKEVGELQTALGELHDCDVWLEGFGRMLVNFQRREEQGASQLTHAVGQQRSAAVWLMRHFARARMKHYSEALALWHEWETGGFFTRLAASLNAPQPALATSPVAPTETSSSDASDTQAQEKPS